MEYVIFYLMMMFIGFLCTGNGSFGEIKTLGVLRWFWNLNKGVLYAFALPILLPIAIIHSVYKG